MRIRRFATLSRNARATACGGTRLSSPKFRIVRGNGHEARFLSRANDAGWLCAITPCETADLVILDHLQQAPVSAAPRNKGDSGVRVEHLLGAQCPASRHRAPVDQPRQPLRAIFQFPRRCRHAGSARKQPFFVRTLNGSAAVT